MKRKRVTELFPGLLPLRKRQRVFCFYAGMSLDGNVYAKERKIDDLPWVQYSGFSLLYNQQTGFDMKYQENKVFNLRLAAKKTGRAAHCAGRNFFFLESGALRGSGSSLQGRSYCCEWKSGGKSGRRLVPDEQSSV